ncbi:cryptochrome/photolyase family protein [Cellvibrio sp. OA-2007]|uniref:cryptochrome/photolyase family protein n=1 Tax=Cellvibrio sp. OA-2007 TaxID=529823 RepID=UPI000781CFAA|nr:cryptochrome/photolyase family protein [Cellvibrio sp. OA-2007]
MKKIRNLCVILGDQLNRDSVLFADFDPAYDVLWMAETLAESTHVPSSKQRSAMFIAAMRHFAQALRDEQLPLLYFSLDEQAQPDFTAAISNTLQHYKVAQLRVVLPGDYRVLQVLKQCCAEHQVVIEVLADNHFIAKPGEFTAWKKGKKQLRMEYWYRQLRKRTGILMNRDAPVGGDWNYDKDNRGTFGKAGPGLLDSALTFPCDEITQGAIRSVETFFPNNPGSLVSFGWPVTRAQALALLDFFIEKNLPLFGEYQDAMWTNEPWLYHSRLSAALNIKLLSPMEVVQAAEQAYTTGQAPLNAVEGFVRQILGWREYVRGLYWSLMPEWKAMNALDAQHNLPDFYWTGDVDMTCLSQSIQQVLDTGYGHHIQRLMVTGLFAQLWQTHPEQIHAWYLAMYVDAVEWVELPNVLGMSQYADGGIMASKPYIATGRYIAKMSNYCDHCRYKPDEAETENACPFTTLYWEFLRKHRARFQQHPRLALQVKHLDNQSEEKRAAIAKRAQWVRAHYPANHYT